MTATPFDRVERAVAAVSAARIAARVQELAAIGRDPDGGITRLGLSAGEQRARELVRSWLAPLGYDCDQDDIANLRCRAGEEPRVLVGSHLDTVPSGGAYDGALGVIAAVEVAQALHQAGVELPLEVVAWTGEEGVRFGIPLLGSAAAAGHVPDERWDRTDPAGTSVREAAAALLGRPPRPETVPLRPAAHRAYLELHIEQASKLERGGAPLGVVSAIVGLHHGRVTVTGRADHAGAAPMGERKDALAGAAECVLAVEEVSAGLAGEAVATVGEIRALPGAKNVVPGACSFTLDVRSVSDERLRQALEALLERIDQVCGRRGLAWQLEPIGEVAAVPLHDGVVATLASACDHLGVDAPRMPSMAAHDAQNLASLGVPTGMLFVRSTGGSHNPAEHAEAGDAAEGARALLLTCAALAASAPGRN